MAPSFGWLAHSVRLTSDDGCFRIILRVSVDEGFPGRAVAAHANRLIPPFDQDFMRHNGFGARRLLAISVGYREPS